jgi:hypothetical protein
MYDVRNDNNCIKVSVPSLGDSDSTNVTSLQACTPKVKIAMLVFTLHLSGPGLYLGLNYIYYELIIS